MMRRMGLALSLMLAACGSPDTDESAVAVADEGSADETPLPPEPVGPSAEQLAQLESRDCREVAQAYSDALARRAFAFAARFWDDPVIDDARLEALFDGYASPAIEIADIRQEGAAGSLYCTVTGALSDASDPARPPRQGEIVLRRANDVPGATPGQLRWTIRSSTFVEPMERSGTGEPA